MPIYIIFYESSEHEEVAFVIFQVLVRRLLSLSHFTHTSDDWRNLISGNAKYSYSQPTIL